MSVEELLKPRYKVIADYPTNEFDINSILPEKVVFGEEAKLKKYPHLFKKLEWWEERDEKDMPEYVKHKIDAEVYKLKKQAETTPSDAYCVKRASIESESYYQWLSLYDLLPATREEYEKYLQSKK